MKSVVILTLFVATAASAVKIPPDPWTNLFISAKLLDANTISTWFRNNGSFNYNPYNQNQPGFEWPKGSGNYCRFASGIWIGARVFNPSSNRLDTLVSVCSYSSEFLPGYTDDNGIPHGKDDPAYRVYKLTLGLNDSDRAAWPNILLGNSNQGAPVYYSSVSERWRPCDVGTQTMYYVYTDSYPESHNTGGGRTRPLKADIKQLNFSFNTNGPLGQIAFSQFTIINRSTSTWNDTYISIWTDDDIGLANDDKVGCDSALNLGYTYNATDHDPIYGAAPPAVAFEILRGAFVHTGNNYDTAYICNGDSKIMKIGYKDAGMTSFNYFEPNGPGQGGDTYRESYNRMQGLKRDGTCRINPNGNYCTRYPFNGNWGQPNAGDQRMMVSTGPVTINPNDTQVIIMAQVIGRGTSNWSSITTMLGYARLTKLIYNGCTWGCIPGPEIPVIRPEHFHLYQNYPNPFNPKTSIKFDVADLGTEQKPRVKLVIYDAIGREMTVLSDKEMEPGNHELIWDAHTYPSGVYFYVLTVSYYAPEDIVYTKTKKMLLLK